MANAEFEEKKFLEYLDRMMAGEEIPPSELPDEKMRADLDFARTMLASKEEPSPQYRVLLRQKLLNKIVSDPAYSPKTAKPSWLTWNRPVWIAAAAALVIVIAGTALWMTGLGGTGQLAMPGSPLPSAEYSVNLPERIAPAKAVFRSEQQLSDKTGTAAVYEISVPEITLSRAAEIATDLGMSGQAAYSPDKSKITVSDSTGGKERQLVIITASGAVEYKYTDAAMLKSGTSQALPSKQEALQTGYAALKQAGLLPYGYDSVGKMESLASIGKGGSYPVMSAAGKAGQSSAQYVTVDLPLVLNGLEATGPGAKTGILVGQGGQIIGFTSYIRDFKPKYSAQTIPEETAFQTVAAGGGSIDIPMNASEVVVKQVKLKYWLEEGKQKLALPVYELEGQTLDKTGKTIEEFKGWTRAVY